MVEVETDGWGSEAGRGLIYWAEVRIGGAGVKRFGEVWRLWIGRVGAETGRKGAENGILGSETEGRRCFSGVPPVERRKGDPVEPSERPPELICSCVNPCICIFELFNLIIVLCLFGSKLLHDF